MILTTDHLRFYQQNQRQPSWVKLIPKAYKMQRVSVHSLIPHTSHDHKIGNSIALLQLVRSNIRRFGTNEREEKNLQEYMHKVIRTHHPTSDAHIRNFKRWLRRMER